ncbi:protein of unknown function [Candidatus Nitrosotalea okcheonensis]|uniref:Uncharacterized protein n=1 Tax=Candidatus Nitrosotalea okcheonensis TaxID=1903276 RepID=A0A2H1FF04_9ARCH|nr:protein of unknown function [Candidatus Nitrosotalea okcheonensis]
MNTSEFDDLLLSGTSSAMFPYDETYDHLYLLLFFDSHT